MRDRFVQIRIERLTDGIDWLQALTDQEIAELFLNESHAGIDRRRFALFACRAKTKVEIVDDRHQLFEQRRVGILDRVVLFAGTTLFVVLEIGLRAQSEIAKSIEVRLHAGHWIFVIDIRGACKGSRRLSCNGGSVIWNFVVSHRNFFHVLRMAIKVMSSCWGYEPAKSRTSSITRLTIADAPLV